MSKPPTDHSVTSAATIISSAGVGVPAPGVTPPAEHVVLGSDSRVSSDEKTIISHDGASTTPGELPERIGPYRITRLIGSGGMGAVYEAEQHNPKRTVALKVMRGAIASPQASRRFEYESQLLARLRHPCIAQVYEAGTHVEPVTNAAVPYFAMEFIPDAKPLTDYATATALSPVQRLELFIRICDAVQHGHQRGIIHRDLKPANILIDSAGHPKIIDFGVARASEDGRGESESAALSTKAGQIVGTLQYMSPEQCGHDSTDIDVRADVYALGVILFELLTGSLPHDLEGTPLLAAVMMIREDAPKRPSSIRRELRGDLDTIILKAIDKDRTRRYGSAADLAADIGRFLRCEPIVARKIGVAGRLSRWVKRHRAVATVLGVSSAVLLATSVTLISRNFEEQARTRLALDAAKANFRLIKSAFFGRLKPNEQKGGMVDVDKVLDAALKQVMDDPPKLAETEADFREIIATGYLGLSQYAKSIELQRRVVELRRQLGETTDVGYADTLHQYAATLWWNGQYDEAAPIYEQSLALRRRLLGNDHADVALSLTHLAACRIKQDKVEEASKLYGQALDMRRRLLGASHQDVAASLNNLAKSEAAAGRYERAESHFREALAMVQRLNGNDDLTTATAKNNLALFLIDSGRAADAIELISSALATRQAKLSPAHHFVILSRLAFARARFAVAASPQAREQAAAEAGAALQSLEKLLSADHPDVIEASGQVGLMLAGSGSREAGLTLLERAAASQRQSRQATPRDRDESGLRLALGRALPADDAEAAKALASTLASIDPSRISNSLRLACVERMRQSADSVIFGSLLASWGKAVAEPPEAKGP